MRIAFESFIETQSRMSIQQGRPEMTTMYNSNDLPQEVVHKGFGENNECNLHRRLFGQMLRLIAPRPVPRG
jgi:hypothetical protein